MKAYAAAKTIDVFRQSLRHTKWDAHTLSNGNWLAVLENPPQEDINRIQASQAVLLPPLDDPESTPAPEFIAMIPAEAGLSLQDSAFKTAKKLFAHTGWPPHRPTRW